MTLREQVEQRAHSVGVVANWGLGNPARMPPRGARLVRAKVAEEYGGNFYAPGRGRPETLQAVAKFSADIDRVSLDPDKNVLISELGTCWFLELLLKGMLHSSPGKPLTVFLPVPYYARHLEATNLPGVKPKLLRCEGPESYARRLIREIRGCSGGGVAVISSVDNPSTNVTTGAEMIGIIAAAAIRGVVVFVDDAYRHVYRHAPILSVYNLLPGALKENVLATLSLAKGHQWPGLKAGALIGNTDLVQLVYEAKSRISEGGDPASQAAMEAALLDYDYLEDTREEYRSLESIIVDGLQNAGWDTAYGSDASIFLRLGMPAKARELGMSSKDLALHLAGLGIITFPYEMFGGEDHIRLCMKESPQQICSALKLIRAFLKS